MLYRATSSVDSITDYNEFSLRRSRYLRILSYLHLHLHLVIWQTLLSKATYNWGIHKAIFNCIISLIFI